MKQVPFAKCTAYSECHEKEVEKVPDIGNMMEKN